MFSRGGATIRCSLLPTRHRAPRPMLAHVNGTGRTELHGEENCAWDLIRKSALSRNNLRRPRNRLSHPARRSCGDDPRRGNQSRGPCSGRDKENENTIWASLDRAVPILREGMSAVASRFFFPRGSVRLSSAWGASPPTGVYGARAQK